MPLEIKELVIRATVSDGTLTTATGTEGGAGATSMGGLSAAERKALVDACVETVLKILEDKKER